MLDRIAEADMFFLSDMKDHMQELAIDWQVKRKLVSESWGLKGCAH